MAESGDRAQSSPSRTASATAAARMRPELVPDIRDMSVHGVMADRDAFGDLAVAEPVGDSVRTSRSHRDSSAAAAGSAASVPGETSRAPATRTSSRRPTEDERPVDVHEPRPRDGSGDVSPTRVGDRAVGAAMHQPRWGARLLEQRAHVHPVSEFQQARCRLGLRGRPLIAHESPPRLAVLRADEEVGKHRDPKPQCARTGRRSPRDVGRRDRWPVSCPIQRRPITRSGNRAANAIAAHPPDEPPTRDARWSPSSSMTAPSRATSSSSVNVVGSTSRSDIPVPGWS